MESQLHILSKVLDFMVYVFPRIVPALVGLMEKLRPVGKMFTKVARLPSEISLPFISSFGSSYAGGAMVVSFHERKVLDDRQALLSAMSLSIPVFFRELFSYFLPTALSILGWPLGCFYVALQVLVMGVKSLFIILMGRRGRSDSRIASTARYSLSLRGTECRRRKLISNRRGEKC